MINAKPLFKNNKLKSIGDPFVLRFNGVYYLYVSSDEPNNSVDCFISYDLVNFEYYNEVIDDDIAHGAYAPEVIYAYNQFYLSISPHGQGHYIYVSDSPLGPFKRITDNIKNMIDGSFILSNKNELYFARANHFGIAISQMNIDGLPYNRKNVEINMNGWTEGPFIINRFGKFYLTCCGNHLLSKGYRTYYMVSDEINQNYHNHYDKCLLINTSTDYHALGHSSTVLAPDLDGYYLVYHNLDQRGGQYYRTLCLDRLQFNKEIMVCNNSHFEIDDPKKPQLYEFLDKTRNNFYILKDFLLSKEETQRKFTCEFNFKGEQIELIFGFQNINSYNSLLFSQNKIIYRNKKPEIIETNFDFKHFRSIRLVNDDQMHIYIDNVYIGSFMASQSGKIGYRNFEENFISYTAFNNCSVGSSDRNYPIVIPGEALLDCNLKVCEKVENSDSSYLILNIDKEYSIRTIGKEGKYRLVILCKQGDRATLLVNGIKVYFKCETNEYEDVMCYLCDLWLKSRDEINIHVIEGTINFKLLQIISLEEQSEILKNIDSNYQVININEKALILKNINKSKYSLRFITQSFNDVNFFGIVFNAFNYSEFGGQPKESFMGYIAGFRNDLLVLEKVEYGLQRIYDVPCNIQLNEEYQLDVEFINGEIKVYLDDKMIIDTVDNFAYFYGMSGIYINSNTDVKIINQVEE